MTRQPIHHVPLTIDHLPRKEMPPKDEPSIPLDLKIDFGKDPQAFERDEVLMEHIRELRRVDVLFTPSNDRFEASPRPLFAATGKVCLAYLHAKGLSPVAERLATMSLLDRTAFIQTRHALDGFPEVTDSAAGAFVEIFLRCGQARYYLERRKTEAVAWAVLALQKAKHSLDFVHELRAKRRGRATLKACGEGHKAQQPYRNQRLQLRGEYQRMAEEIWAKKPELPKSEVARRIHRRLEQDYAQFGFEKREDIPKPETIARAIKKPERAASE